MKRYFTWLGTMVLGVSLGLMGGVASVFAGTASSVFNFTAIFVGGTCDISAPAAIQFNGGSPLTSSEIEQKTAVTNEGFNITLSNCAGWGLTPAIKVSGTTISDFGEPLFRDAAGKNGTNGYGILLQTPGNATFNLNLNLAENGRVSAKSWSTDDQLSTVDTALPMVASLRCGDCNYPDRHGGEFKATVTFDFVYE
ncbi:hypothetical protein K7H99_20370 (plasmid) [Providencia rettgeri]|uniref:fimbrial protein n=1 Tax=Providencia rettgeri TaxID=587 RepID=UPI001CA6B280|nr:fimbrial protein [Providencia rettgeri]QZY66575.1 hypothetical protein K7H99_20370 [Providencia rettgeri]